MKFYILTIFPDFYTSCLSTSIIKRAIENNLIEVELINIRDFSKNKHQKVDDYPYGGGPGMVMTPQPISDAIKHAKNDSEDAQVIYFSPHGRLLEQNMVNTLSKENNFILLCGHYEGIDYRIVEKYVDLEISIGDYILTGGEIASLVFMDTVSRQLEGVLGNNESATNESFSNVLLEHPQYTRPPIFEGAVVPEILLSGHHEKIQKWRQDTSEKITQEKRPDLYNKYKK